VELALGHLDSLYAAARRLTRDASYAEDLVQEAFLRGYRYFRHMTDSDGCKAILYKIMLNFWLKERRRQQREVGLGDSPDDLPWKPSSTVQSSLRRGNPECEVLEKKFLADVDRALQKLSPELRVTVLLADIEGFTYQEMADLLRCPVGTVMSRLHRARRFLERELHAYVGHAKHGGTQT
jgi:RNA polymerase sigma-70 factor (ECF subfamily)